MPSLDLRSRTSEDIRDVDAEAFFASELPLALEADGGLAVAAAAGQRTASLSFVLPTGAHTLGFDGERFAVVPGDAGAAAVALDEHDLAALVNDLKTPMALFTGGTLDMRRGRLEDLLDWWVVLRAVLDRRLAHAPGDVALLERDGRPLDLGRHFTPDADDADIAHFLTEAGFLHLRGWLEPADMAQVSADMDAALPTYEPDDGRSWWARTDAGDDRCVRMQGFDEHSPTTAAILDGEALARIADLTNDGHGMKRFGASRVEALEKPVGVVEGISDVPWHKDCSLGMHSYNCCSLVVGVSVTGADATSGQLRVVAGSHRALVPPAFLRAGFDLPVVDLPTETGDLTVHCSCTLHMAQPPETRERRVLYTGMGLRPKVVDDALVASVKELGRVREGSYKTVSQPPAHRTVAR